MAQKSNFKQNANYTLFEIRIKIISVIVNIFTSIKWE